MQKQLITVIKPIWMLTTSEDFRWPGTEGGKPDVMVRGMHWYLDQLQLLAPTNANVVKTFLEVQQLLRPPTALFQPGFIAQVGKRLLFPVRSA